MIGGNTDGMNRPTDFADGTMTDWTIVGPGPGRCARAQGARAAGAFEWLHASGVDTLPLADTSNWRAALKLTGGLVANAEAGTLVAADFWGTRLRTVA